MKLRYYAPNIFLQFFRLTLALTTKYHTRKKVGSFKIYILLQVDSLVKQQFCKTRIFNNNCIFYLKRLREKLLPSKGNHYKIVAYILQVELSNKQTRLQ